MWGFFSGALVAIAAAILTLLRRYAAPSVPLVVKAATTYAWLVAFIVLVRGQSQLAGVGPGPFGLQAQRGAEAPQERARSLLAGSHKGLLPRARSQCAPLNPKSGALPAPCHSGSGADRRVLDAD
jgi:hypothetical protein